MNTQTPTYAGQEAIRLVGPAVERDDAEAVRRHAELCHRIANYHSDPVRRAAYHHLRRRDVSAHHFQANMPYSP